MTYHVTARDIVHGEKSNNLKCPVARAIKRRHPTKHVWVGGFYAIVGTTQYTFSPRVWLWLDRFDAGQAVSPMRFELL